MIYGCFPPDRRIYLRQERRWHLHNGYTAHVTCSSETRHVSDHATTQCEKYSFSIAPIRKQSIKNRLQYFPIFMFLTIREQNFMNYIKPSVKPRP